MTDRPKFTKAPKYGNVYSEVVATPPGPLVWLYVVTMKEPMAPRPGEQEGKPRYEASIILNKDVPANKAFIDLMTADAAEMLKLFNIKNKTPLASVQCYQDGDEFDLIKYPFYANSWILQGRNYDKQPRVVDALRKPIDAGSLLGGMVGALGLTPRITKGGFGYKLESIQLIKDEGQRFGGGVRDVTGIFDVIGETAPEEEDSLPGDAEAVATETVPETVKASAKGKKGLDSAIVDRL